MVITFSSCFYVIKSKYGVGKYVEWMNNLISIVNKFNLVIYTDLYSIKYIRTNNNPRIKIVIKQMEQFYNYKYKNYWIVNHKKNISLNDRTDWELNMLWSEKIQFVKDTAERKYFESDLYGWCDIGYFRNRSDDTHTSSLDNWGSNTDMINIDLVNYGLICDMNYLRHLSTKKHSSLPIHELPVHAPLIGGGFFVLRRDMVSWWATTYDEKLRTYFENGRLVKDDQIIITDCFLSNVHMFKLFDVKRPGFDKWFMFQRILN